MGAVDGEHRAQVSLNSWEVFSGLEGKGQWASHGTIGKPTPNVFFHSEDAATHTGRYRKLFQNVPAIKEIIHNWGNPISQTSNFGHEEDNKKQRADSCHEEHKANTVLQQANIPYLQTGRHCDILSPSLSFPHLSIKEDGSSAVEAQVNK